ncbi:RHS repeat domain-containing protein [Ralstonia soli]|uniref:RHS repeat protein n=1 Tax=Ralstonia soli TaxID=2953896 RepID=A0ABT1ATP6_9RALS|nr:RHS repeat domain-containing protein [Ralstonia soli]MCO5401589.1 RHS repeat protein [Ralstonia soli]
MLRPSLLLGCLSVAVLGTAQAEAPRVIDVPAGSFYVVNGVNVRNGNYSTTFSTLRDADDPAGEPFHRVYNSFSDHQGAYGLGWSTVMDSRIELAEYSDDLALDLKENGVAATTQYVVQPGGPGSGRTKAMEKGRIDIQMEYKFQVHQVATRREMMQTDFYREAVKRGELKPFSESSMRDPAYPSMEPVIPEGAVFVAKNTFQGDTCRGKSRIVRQGGNLIRTYPEGCGIAREIYTLNGECIRVDNKAGDTLTITKDPATRRVTSVRDEKGGTIRFQYDAKGRLVRESNPKGNAYGFEYDERDNMTAIIYIDNTKSRMAYDDKNRVTLSAPRNRPVARFEYRKDPSNPGISITHVKMTQGDQTEEVDYRLH